MSKSKEKKAAHAAEVPAPSHSEPTGSESRRWRYVGPHYERGIVLPGGNIYRPAEWTDEEVRRYRRTLPEAVAWFEPVEA